MASRASRGPKSELTPLRLIVFDCDGTLVDSQATIVACAQAAFLAEGLPIPTAEAVRRIVGLSLVEAVLELMAEPDPAVAPRLAEHYKAAFHEYRVRPEFHEPLFPGTRELLDALLARDLRLGVATGKAMRGLLTVLEHHGLRDHFVTLQTRLGSYDQLNEYISHIGSAMFAVPPAPEPGHYLAEKLFA